MFRGDLIAVAFVLSLLGMVRAFDAEPVYVTKRIEGAMIIDEHRAHSLHGKRRFAHAQNFTRSLFQSLNLVIRHDPRRPNYSQELDENVFKVKEWPAIFTSNCPDTNPVIRPGHSAGMDRGLTLAHRECMEQWLRRRRHSPQRQLFNESEDVLVIFEEDVYPTVPQAALAMVTEIEKMSATSPVSEIAYLGWCYLTDAEKPPLCMHSYAVTVPAARMLLEEVDACGIMLDVQVQQAVLRSGLGWRLTAADDYEKEKGAFLAKSLSENGATVPAILTFGGFGGIFTQADLDDPLEKIEDQQLIKGKSGRSVYLWANGSLHQFPNLETFIKMGKDFSDEIVVTDWQLRSLPKGDDLPSLARKLGAAPKVNSSSLDEVEFESFRLRRREGANWRKWYS